jgi:hypothetical protein
MIWILRFFITFNTPNLCPKFAVGEIFATYIYKHDLGADALTSSSAFIMSVVLGAMQMLLLEGRQDRRRVAPTEGSCSSREYCIPHG